MDPLVVPPRAFEPEAVVALPEAPAPMLRDDGQERGDHGRIALRRGDRRPIIRRPRQPHDLTCAANRQRVLSHQHVKRLSFRGRRYSFRARTSLMAAFSSARSAYIRFSRTFSPSSSRSRFTSATDAPAYLLRHLKNVVLLMPCCRKQVSHRDTGLRFLENPDDLTLGELRFPHARSFRPGAVYLRVSTEGGSLRWSLPIKVGSLTPSR